MASNNVTNFERLCVIADQLGLVPVLDRLGLRGRLAEIVRLSCSSAERQRWDIIYEDYRRSRQLFGPIVRDVPSDEGLPGAWIVASMNTPWGLRLDGTMSLVARVAGFRPVSVRPIDDPWTVRYHAIFRLNEGLSLRKFRSAGGANGSDGAAALSSTTSIPELLDLQYRRVDVGRIALSNLLTRRKFSRFEIDDEETRVELVGELRQIYANVRAAEAMLQAHRPSLVLLLEKGLSPVAEIFGICLANGVPVIQYVGSQNENDLVLKRYSRENRHQHPFSLDMSTWKRIREEPWSDEQAATLMTEFEEAYSKGTWFNRKFLHQDKKIKSPEEVRSQLQLDSSKKTAVVFSHVLWDATFFYGKGLFDNYEQWLIETIKAANANPELNWLIKLHPDLVWKLKYERYEGELHDLTAIRDSVGILAPHVRLVLPDTDISSYSFFGITNYCVTVRGTIGIEMACHGVPVVTAGTGRYAGLGFTIDSDTREEYLSRLAGLATLPPMTAEQMNLARRFAYALFKQRLWPMRSFEIVKRPLKDAGHPLDHNVIPHVSSFQETAKASDIRDLAHWLNSGSPDYLRSVALHI